mgnify:CR=1 FL=1
MIESITDMGDRLRVIFKSGKELFVRKNINNALRQKLENEYPELYPEEPTES